jgi:TRAP transporter TAXI family solute receptor
VNQQEKPMAIPLFIRTLLAGVLLAAFAPPSADAETAGEHANRGLVELLTGSVDGTGAKLGADLADLLDDGATRRVLPVIGKGALQNLTDLRALRGIDLAIVQADVLENAKRKTNGAIDASVTYVAKLHNEELHLLAGAAITRIEDLAGKKVNVGSPSGGTAQTASALFDQLQIKIEATGWEPAMALAKLRTGEIAALADVTGKPAALFAGLRAPEGLHFLAIPLKPELLSVYLPTRLTADDYPELVPNDAPVDTLAVGTVLLAANLAPDSERYRNVVQFVDAFFTHFPRLLEPPHQAKWHEVNLAAELPGWHRFPTAESWLKRNTSTPVATPGEQQMREIFARFLDERSRATTGKTLSGKDKDQLFEQFRQWQQSSQAR